MSRDPSPAESTPAPASPQGVGEPPPALRPRTLAALGLTFLVLVGGGFELLRHIVVAPVPDPRASRLLHLLAALAGATGVTAVVVSFVVHRAASAFSPSPTPGELPPLLDLGQRQHRQLLWLIKLRWAAAGVILALVAITTFLVPVLPDPAEALLIAWAVVLLLANLIFEMWALYGRHPQRQMVVQMVVDLVILTGLLNASGGLENPLYIAYLFHIILASILLPNRKAVAISVAAGALFCLLIAGEYTHALPHYTTGLFPHEHAAAHGGGREPEADPDAHAAHDPLFVTARALPFLGVLALTSYLTMLLSSRLRRSELELASAARAALLERHQLESIVHAAGLGITVYDLDGRRSWRNRRAEEWSAWKPNGTEVPAEPEAAGGGGDLVSETFRHGSSREQERTVTTPAGERRYLRRATSPVRDPGGRVVQVVELMEDVTGRKALEAEALHAGKLSVLGQMAAGIAHEIGNPLSSLKTRLHLMERRQDPDFTRESLALLQGQIDRIGRIVRGISEFSHHRAAEWSVLRVNPLVEEALSIVQLDRRSQGIAFRCSCQEPSPQIRGVRDQVEQVFLNLLLNAVQAIPNGGHVTVETAADDDSVSIHFIDDGTGMDEAVRRHLFEPFFTTKPKGTGLGLSISYSLVHAHGGSIEVASAPGEGSHLVVHLPAAGAGEPAPTPEGAAS